MPRRRQPMAQTAKRSADGWGEVGISFIQFQSAIYIPCAGFVVTIGPKWFVNISFFASPVFTRLYIMISYDTEWDRIHHISKHLSHQSYIIIQFACFHYNIWYEELCNRNHMMSASGSIAFSMSTKKTAPRSVQPGSKDFQRIFVTWKHHVWYKLGGIWATKKHLLSVVLVV